MDSEDVTFPFLFRKPLVNIDVADRIRVFYEKPERHLVVLEEIDLVLLREEGIDELVLDHAVRIEEENLLSEKISLFHRLYSTTGRKLFQGRVGSGASGGKDGQRGS